MHKSVRCDVCFCDHISPNRSIASPYKKNCRSQSNIGWSDGHTWTRWRWRTGRCRRNLDLEHSVWSTWSCCFDVANININISIYLHCIGKLGIKFFTKFSNKGIFCTETRRPFWKIRLSASKFPAMIALLQYLCFTLSIVSKGGRFYQWSLWKSALR